MRIFKTTGKIISWTSRKHSGKRDYSNTTPTDICGLASEIAKEYIS